MIRMVARYRPAAAAMVRRSQRLQHAVGRILQTHALVIAAKAKLILGRVAKSGSSRLAGTIHTSPLRSISGQASIDIKWGLPYGRILEYGPRVKQWVITARNAPHLVFYSQYHGSIIKKKQVIHRWDKSQLREHVGPAVETHWPDCKADLAEILERIG